MAPPLRPSLLKDIEEDNALPISCSSRAIGRTGLLVIWAALPGTTPGVKTAGEDWGANKRLGAAATFTAPPGRTSPVPIAGMRAALETADEDAVPAGGARVA